LRPVRLLDEGPAAPVRNRIHLLKVDGTGGNPDLAPDALARKRSNLARFGRVATAPENSTISTPACWRATMRKEPAAPRRAGPSGRGGGYRVSADRRYNGRCRRDSSTFRRPAPARGREKSLFDAHKIDASRRNPSPYAANRKKGLRPKPQYRLRAQRPRPQSGTVPDL